MGYVNRFTFSNTYSFKYVYRGIDYLNNIRDFEIDGNVVSAKIYGTKPYSVTFGINFIDKTIMYPKCTCPYIESHRNCKHIVALMFYTDIYLNGGSIEDMIIHFIAFHLSKSLIKLNKTKDAVFLEDVEKIVVGQNLNILDYDIGYKMPYLELLKNVSKQQFEDALGILKSKEIVQIDRRNRIWTNINLAKRYKNPYYLFFAKYELLEGRGDYVYDYWNDTEYYDKDEIYYYGKEVNEYKKGIDLNYFGSFFVGNKLGEILFDMKCKRIVFPSEDDDFNIFDCIEFPNLSISNTLIEFYISTIKDDKLRESIASDYETSDFKVEQLDSIERSKFNKIKNNFVIGLATKYCLENKINFYFE